MLYQWQDKKPTYQAPFTGWVADSAEIIGDVHLADNVSVWFGAVIRADNAPIYLGKNSNVQENSVIHTDEGIAVTIGEGVTIGHLAMLHGCTVGDNSLIGIGAMAVRSGKTASSVPMRLSPKICKSQIIPS